MSKPNFVQVSAPGLPPWPQLWFDAQHKHAVVSARLATWRSVESAARACGIIWLLGSIIAGWRLWLHFSDQFQRGEALLVTLFCVAIVVAFARPIVHGAFRGFLARQIFCSRVRVWFRPNAIAFRSRLYSSPVVLWRSWKGDPVQGRFELTNDPEAAELDDWDARKRIQGSAHLKHAYVLRMIVTTTNPHKELTFTHQSNFVREIPMLEISAEDSARFTTVLTAAASLTATKPDDVRPNNQATTGIDIDEDKAGPT